MIINRFKTRIPFFSTSDINERPMTQDNRKVCADCYGAALNPRDFYPEFVLEKSQSNSIAQIQVASAPDGGIVATITGAALPLCRHFFYSDSEGDYEIVMFPGMTGAELTCGRKYRYIITTTSAEVFYSDYFEAIGPTEDEAMLSNEYTVLKYTATCTTAGIPYALFAEDEFYNRIYLACEKLNPETEIQIENKEDNTGRIISSNQALWKRYVFHSPKNSDPVVDALNTVPIYINGESVKLITNILGDGKGITVKDFDIEKPDYKINECTPSIKGTIAIDTRLLDAGCCDSSSISRFDDFDPECYLDFTPPTLNGSNAEDNGDHRIKIQINNTPGGSGTEIPTGSLCKVWYKAFPSGPANSGGIYTDAEMAASVFIPTGPGSWQVALQILGDRSGSCESAIGAYFRVNVA